MFAGFIRAYFAPSAGALRVDESQFRSQSPCEARIRVDSYSFSPFHSLQFTFSLAVIKQAERLSPNRI